MTEQIVQKDIDITQVHYCVYYNAENYEIREILPKNISEAMKANIIKLWSESIPREILIALSSNGEMSAAMLKEIIGHSSSTLHENVRRLEEYKLIETTIIYKGNKQRLLRPKVLFVSKNPRFKTIFQKFFQGLFVDSEKTKRIIKTLDSSPDKYFTIEEISIKSGIPADEIEILLSNWESQVTRSLSEFLKKKPFEKKVLYKSTKGKK